MNPNHIAVSLTFLLALTMAGGCSLPWSKPVVHSNPTAVALLKEGDEALKDKRYNSAIMRYEEIREEFPFSAEAREMDLKIAEAYYLGKKYSEAEQAFKDFIALRPTHKEVPFALYHLGMVHLDQFKGVDRDQKNIKSAKGYFESIIRVHPKSPYAAKAKEKLGKCRQYLAEREFYVGSFYMKEKKYSAAKDRFETIVRQYLDTPVGVQALYRLGESYGLQNNSVKAALAYESLIKHFPDSQLTEKARSQLNRLEKTQQDPLAQLLIRDGRPVFTPGSDGRIMAGSGKNQKPKTKNRDGLKLVAKKGVVYEEEGVKKGFFRRMVDTVNPFDSNSDEPPDKSGKSDKSKDQNEAGPAVKKKGLFRRIATSINPFASSDNSNGNGKKKAALPVKPRADRKLFAKIDEGLKQKGIDLETEMKASAPPTPELPRITEEPKVPPSHAKKVLGKVDKILKKENKGITESTLPPPVSPHLFATRPPKESQSKSEKASKAVSKLLSDIDKKMKRKGMEPPKESKIARKPVDLEASQPQGQKRIELNPRLSKEAGPFFLDPGQFQTQEKVSEKKTRPEVPEAVGDNGVQASQASTELPAAVVKSPSATHATGKAEETKTAHKGLKGEEAEPRMLDQLKEEKGLLKKIFNPFGWGQ